MITRVSAAATFLTRALIGILLFLCSFSHALAQSDPCAAKINSVTHEEDAGHVHWAVVYHNFPNHLTFRWRGGAQTVSVIREPDYNPWRHQIDASCMLSAEELTVETPGCNGTTERKTITVAPPDMQPKLEAVAAAPGWDPSTIKIDWIMANASTRRLRAVVLSSGNVFMDKANFGTVLGGQEGPSIPQDAEGPLLVKALACNAFSEERIVESESSQDDCEKCDKSCSNPPECTGDPVNTFSGNMRFEDIDPLPSNAFFPFRRTYLSRRSDTGGFFGARWFSAFDARLATFDDIDGSRYVSVFTETRARLVFRGQNGQYTQVSPTGTRPATLAQLPDGTWLETDGDRRLARVFSPQGSPLAYREVPTGREVRIVWSAGLPVRMEDSWGNWALVVATNTTGRIASLTVEGRPDLVWRYVYEQHLTRVDSPAGVWRSYDYSNFLEPGYRQRLRVIRDGAGNIIESHEYERYGSGRAVSSLGPSGEIESITVNQSGRTPDERSASVRYRNGRTETHYRRYLANRWRTVEILDGCSTCGGQARAVVLDSYGNAVRSQSPDGYITSTSYDATGTKVLLTRTALRPSGCDPATAADVCRLTTDTLAAAELVPTAASVVTTNEYGDPNWPHFVTATSTTSVLQPSGARRDAFTYDGVSGQELTRSVTGWTGVPVRQETRLTTSTLYDGVEGAAFAPGGAFSAAWLSLPQPRMRKSTNGPRTDDADITSFVYYPIDSTVPGSWRGRLAAIRNPAGHNVRFDDYDVFGNATRTTDTNGVQHESTVDPLGRLTASTIKGVPGCDTAADPLCNTDLTVTRTYSNAGPLASEAQPGGGVTSYTYDDRGRVRTFSRGPSLTDLREQIELTYDPLTGKKSIDRFLARESGSWVEKKRLTSVYNLSEQLQETRHADGSSVSYDYDPAGRVQSVRDENHTTPNTEYDYDPAGRLRRVRQSLATAPSGWVETVYEYDLHGNLTAVIDPNGNVTRYLYDDFGAMLTQTSPVTGVTSYSYDTSGQLVSVTDANGATTTRTYDALGRILTAVATRAASSESVSWTYDSGVFGIGRLVSMTDPSGSTNYTYERRGLLALESKSIAGVTYTTGFRYDANGNRSRIDDPSGRSAGYTFDHAGRPHSASTGTTTLVTSAKYLPFGPPTEIVLGNGTTKRMTYDARYRPLTNALTGAGGSIASYAYGHDPAGNITAIHDALDPTYNRDFAYDDLHRLTTANSGAALWGNGTFTYDAMGNLQSLALGTSRNASFSYETNTPKLTSATENGVTRAVAYDAAGNEQLAGAEAFVYSARNQLLSGDDISYVYDGRGIRVITSRAMALPAITSLLIAPPSVAGGADATATVTLSAAAPAGGISVDLSSDNEAVATPPFVLVPEGSTSANAIITTSAVAVDVTGTLTATLGASTRAATLTVRAPRLELVALSATQVTGGTAVTGTLTLDGIAPEGGLTVAVTSSAAAASVPTQVEVAAELATADFTIATSAVTAEVTATITATLGAVSRTASLTVGPAGLSQLQFAPQTLRGGATTTGTVSLGGPAPSGGATIALSSSSAELTLPSSVIVPAGSTNATFTASASPVETAIDVVVTSGYLGTSQTGVVTITPPDLVTFEVTPALVIGGEIANAQATIDAPAASGGASVSITSSDPTLVPPANLTVPPGTTSGSTSLPTNPVAASASVVVSATRNGITRSSVVTVQPAPVSLASLLVTPATLVGSNDATGTITLTHPAPAGLEVELTSSDPARASVPSIVTVPSGATQASFAIATSVVSTPASITITATHGVTSKTASLTLQPPPANHVAGLSVVPQFIAGGSTATATVTLASASTTNGGSAVTLTSSDPSLRVPPAVTVKKNQTSETFTISTSTVTAPRSVVVTASYGGVVRHLTIIVAPENTVTLATFTVSPPRVAGGNPVAGTITLSGPAPFGGALITLTPSRHNMVTVPDTITITEGITSATFVIGTDPVHGNKDRAVDIEAEYNGLTRTATLTLAPPGAASGVAPAIQCASMALAPCLTTSATRIATATATPTVDRYSFYTPELNLLAESEESTSAGKAIRYSYVWFAGQPLAQIDNSTGEIAHYFNDHLGTPVLQTSSTGAVVWRVEREPYGKTFTKRTGADRYQPLAFPGQENDGSELFYNIFRWYRSEWGRYTQADPLGLKGGSNIYRYAGANPMNNTDRLGLVSWTCNIGYVSYETPGAGPGAASLIASCTSDCVNKKRVKAVVAGNTGGASLGSYGLPFGASYSTNVDLFDDLKEPKASSLEGLISIGSVGAGIGFSPLNYSYTYYRLGLATGWSPGVSDFMVSLGFDFYLGAGSVVKQQTECCE